MSSADSIHVEKGDVIGTDGHNKQRTIFYYENWSTNYEACDFELSMIMYLPNLHTLIGGNAIIDIQPNIVKRKLPSVICYVTPNKG